MFSIQRNVSGTYRTSVVIPGKCIRIRIRTSVELVFYMYARVRSRVGDMFLWLSPRKIADCVLPSNLGELVICIDLRTIVSKMRALWWDQDGSDFAHRLASLLSLYHVDAAETSRRRTIFFHFPKNRGQRVPRSLGQPIVIDQGKAGNILVCSPWLQARTLLNRVCRFTTVTSPWRLIVPCILRGKVFFNFTPRREVPFEDLLLILGFRHLLQLYWREEKS